MVISSLEPAFTMHGAVKVRAHTLLAVFISSIFDSVGLSAFGTHTSTLILPFAPILQHTSLAIMPSRRKPKSMLCAAAAS